MRLPLVLIVLTLGLGACADDNVSVFVRGNIAPEKADDGCVYSPGSEFVTQGLWDITGSQRYGGSYQVHLAVVNQIQRRASTVASEPNGVHIMGAEVTLRKLGGEPFSAGELMGLPNPFSVPAAVYIDPADGPDSPGQAAVTVSAVPADYSTALMAAGAVGSTIVASIRLVGETSGHIDVRTDEYDYPIGICDGCLFSCPATAEDVSLACDPGVNFGSLDPSDPACGL